MAERKTISLTVVNQAGEKISKVLVNKTVFGIEPNKQVMFDAVQVYQANMRQATAKTLRRDEVSGGGKKPWRQKGTGRARAGSSRSPLWRGGGNVFGPVGNQNYKLSMNKEAHRLALRSALSLKVKEDAVIVVDEFKLEAPKTKVFVDILDKINATDKVLLVLDAENENLFKSARNLANVLMVGTANVSVYDLLNADHVVFTKSAIKSLEGGLN